MYNTAPHLASTSSLVHRHATHALRMALQHTCHAKGVPVPHLRTRMRKHAKAWGVPMRVTNRLVNNHAGCTFERAPAHDPGDKHPVAHTLMVPLQPAVTTLPSPLKAQQDKGRSSPTWEEDTTRFCEIAVGGG